MLPEILKTPEFYDNFGLIIFGFITAISIWKLKTKKKFPKLIIYSLLGIGILGLIVDGAIVSGVLQTLGMAG